MSTEKVLWSSNRDMDTHHMSLRQNTEGKVRGKGWEGGSVGEIEENEVVGWRTEWGQEDGDPHDWRLRQNQVYRPISLTRTTTSRWVRKKYRWIKSSYKRSEVTTTRDMNFSDDGIGTNNHGRIRLSISVYKFCSWKRDRGRIWKKGVDVVREYELKLEEPPKCHTLGGSVECGRGGFIMKRLSEN